MNEKTIQIEFRSIALEKIGLVKGKKSGPEYTSIVKGCLKGRNQELLRNRLLKSESAEHEKELSRQEDLIAFIRDDLDKVSKDIRLEKAFISDLEQQRKKAYEVYMQAKETLEKIEARLKAAQNVMSQFASNQTSLEKSITAAEERRNEINQIILVHKSAKISQLMKYSFGKVVVTKVDAKALEGAFVPDVIFDNDLARGLFNEPPFSLKQLPEDEAISIMEFLQMAMYYYATEDVMPIILYANNEIASALKKEGL